jgi:hypothetical protein
MMKIADTIKNMKQLRNFDSLAEAQLFLDKVYALEESRPVFYHCTLVQHRPQLLN